MGILFDNLLQVNFFKGNSGPIHVGPEKKKNNLKSKGDLLIQQAKDEKERARALPVEQYNLRQLEGGNRWLENG